MPLEIKELHIKVTVNQPQQDKGQADSVSGNHSSEDKEAIINQCIEEVFEIINNKKER